jgi:hypothetical protein
MLRAITKRDKVGFSLQQRGETGARKLPNAQESKPVNRNPRAALMATSGPVARDILNL